LSGTQTFTQKLLEEASLLNSALGILSGVQLSVALNSMVASATLPANLITG
jgi:hypothetical protein